MKMVYSHENQFLVSNIKNLIDAQGIETFMKNEFAQGAIGEVSAFDSWPEVWVVDDGDEKKALKIVQLAQSGVKRSDWCCNHCTEMNDPSFEICWHCQTPSEH